jgi:hypothetical protein
MLLAGPSGLWTRLDIRLKSSNGWSRLATATSELRGGALAFMPKIAKP